MSSLESDRSSLQTTSASLIRRVQSNEPTAWQRLVRLYGPLVYSWCRRHGLPNEDAADVVQEVFTAVAQAIARFDTERLTGRFRGWLWTITRNKLRDARRRTGDQPIALGGDTAWRELAQLPEIWSDDSSRETRDEVRLLYHRALAFIRAEFQPQTWQAFWKAVIEDQPTDVIARELGLSANGVRQAKSRVLRRLRAELGDDPAAPGDQASPGD